MFLKSVARTAEFLQVYEETGFVMDLGNLRWGAATHPVRPFKAHSEARNCCPGVYSLLKVLKRAEQLALLQRFALHNNTKNTTGVRSVRLFH
jgi:hypothetical protein